ncbi:MAG: DNA-deoxyinosine glycosylase [Clostridiales bacterium]|nr:DNA-deoxyinosine glycosylase [Clostridiales bacterium]
MPPGYVHAKHEFEPVYDRHSRILILGSFPSVKSRETSFYYGHPQNRFWKLLAALTGQDMPETIEEKTRFLLENRIALWDVVEECDILGSSDLSIRNVIPNDINRILEEASIEIICANGSEAFRLYKKYCREKTGREAVKCPSTSPANAVWSLERLTEAWGKTLEGWL